MLMKQTREDKVKDNKQLPYSLNKYFMRNEEKGRARMMNGTNNNEKNKLM